MSEDWVIKGDDRLYWHQWGDEHVLYDDRTGHTHKLDMVSARVVQMLQAAARTEAELRRELSAEFGIPDDDDLQVYVSKLIGQFRLIGLLESAMS